MFKMIIIFSARPAAELPIKNLKFFFYCIKYISAMGRLIEKCHFRSCGNLLKEMFAGVTSEIPSETDRIYIILFVRYKIMKKIG